MSRSYWLLIATLGGCLSVSVPSYGFQSDSYPNGKPAKSNQTNSKPPQHVAVGPSQEDQEKAQREEAARQRAEDRDEADLAAQRAMADSAAELTKLTDKQISEIQRSNEYLFWTLVATGAAAIFALIATGAAIVSVCLSRDTDKRSLRAYISTLPGVFVDQDRKLDRKIAITRKIINTGQTPAYDVATVFQGRIWDVEHIENAQIFAVEPVGQPAFHVLGPGQEHEVSWINPALFDEKDMNAARMGAQKRLYVFGLVTYRDAFGKARYTQFCDYITRGPKGGFISVNTGKHSKAT